MLEVFSKVQVQVTFWVNTKLVQCVHWEILNKQVDELNFEMKDRNEFECFYFAQK